VNGSLLGGAPAYIAVLHGSHHRPCTLALVPGSWQECPMCSASAGSPPSQRKWCGCRAAATPCSTRPRAPGHCGEREGRPPCQPHSEERGLNISVCAPSAHGAPGRGLLLLGAVSEGVGECWLCGPLAGVQAFSPERGGAARQRLGQGPGGLGSAAAVLPLQPWVLRPQVLLEGDYQV